MISYIRTGRIPQPLRGINIELLRYRYAISKLTPLRSCGEATLSDKKENKLGETQKKPLSELPCLTVHYIQS